MREVDEILIAEVDTQHGKRFIDRTGDVSKPETGAEFVKEVVEAFGRLDIFVSNAGVCQFKEFLEYVYNRIPHGRKTSIHLFKPLWVCESLSSNIRKELTLPSSTIQLRQISPGLFTRFKRRHAR